MNSDRIALKLKGCEHCHFSQLPLVQRSVKNGKKKSLEQGDFARHSFFLSVPLSWNNDHCKHSYEIKGIL